MTRRERIEAVLSGRTPDRTPVLGGWIAAPEHIQSLAGVTEDAYWDDPFHVSIRAYDALQNDALIGVFVPSARGKYRCVDAGSYVRADAGCSIEEAVTRIDAMSSPEQVEKDFDFEAQYAAYRQSMIDNQEAAGEMVWMPAAWGGGAQASWYGEFGYETYFLIIALHPDRARKLMEVGGARGRCQSRLVARAVTEGIYPKACLLGEDICTQRGPMIAPDFLERYYAPELKRGLAPLLEAGCRPVWHCDGDVRPLLDMLIDCGVQGLQGFQPECGMRIEELVQRRTRDGGKLLFFGPLAVTTELPVMTPEQVRRRVRDVIALCRDRADLVLFTGNTINPDVPLANVKAMCEEAVASSQ